MKKIQVKLKLLVLFVIVATAVQAQESVNTAGGNASGSGGTVSYSFGQVANQTHSGTTGSIAEGVQQPYEISVVTGTDELNAIQLNVEAYPNPTTDKLTLSIDAPNPDDFSYQLFEIQGRLIESNHVIGGKTSIVMQHLVPATYLLKVFSAQQPVKTFKIIKR
ncbi:T9SS type A sorting domain-containing protein [Mariniphaga sediminis]|uniref:T9SS type A sorting domain-containing protein n=1 Tax=Mariniphaga sediminis TaxID=1628158 RepID=UPI003566CCBB